VATIHRLIVLPAPAVLCEISYSGGGVSNRSSVHHERPMETLESCSITPSHFSTAISSVLHTNFWLQLSTIGDNDSKSWPCHGQLRFSSALVRTLSGYACTKLATFSFPPCFKAFSLVIFLAMLSRLRPNTMRKSPFQPRASASQKAMPPPLFALRWSSFETCLLKAGVDLNRQLESSRWTDATCHDAIRC
jgi:hypothetical protein